MKPGPLRQAVGVIGLLALVPTAVLLAGGALGSREAALRAVVTLLGVVVVGRLVGAWLHAAASGLEAAAASQGAPAGPRQEAPAGPRQEAPADPRQEATTGPTPRRRASDGSGDPRSSTAAGA